MHIRRVQRVGAALKTWIYFQDYVILVQLPIHHRDLPLTERVTENGVHLLRSHAQARGGCAVNLDSFFQAMVLLIAVCISKLWKRPKLIEDAWRPGSEIFKIIGLQSVLKLRIGHASADLQVLR